jgi:hypothetical protein
MSWLGFQDTTSPGLENREYGSKDPSRRPSDTFYRQKLALTSPTRCGLSVVIVRSWTMATKWFVIIIIIIIIIR